MPTSLENRPQTPWYFVSGLTTNISSTFTNDFHYSYLRNYWSWNNNGAAPLAGLGGALEPFGEYSTTSLTPVNVNTQSTRTRIWDGHDHFLRDDLTKLKGNHLVQFGGQYQHNFAFHNRTDNGSGIDYFTTYQLGDSTGAGLVQLTGITANGLPATASQTNGRIVAASLGIVTDSQVAYTRTGNNLVLNPPLTPAADYSTIPFYNLYVSDTWKLKPSLTINYGLGWALEMPPHEATGKQVSLVDASDEPIKTFDYLAQRQAAAIAGTVYNPQVGFALVGNVGSGLKYPFNPFYAGFSPRISAAYNPNVSDGFVGKLLGGNATVIRGGYGRVYGRLNGVGLVLTPLLGPGLIQAVNCRTALSNGTCGSASPTDTTAFRIGVDGNSAPLQTATQNLPQPFYPGYNGSASTAASVLDPNFRPNDVDTFNLTIQRQISRKMLVEVGYIGRLIHHEYEPININTVPYMMSQGGQTFASAYAAIETAFGCATSQSLCAATLTRATTGAKVLPAVSNQPFFETALAGTGYCNNYSSCTAAVVAKQTSQLANQQVFNLWTNLDNGGFNFQRSLMGTAIPGQASGGSGQVGSGVQLSTASGYGNYNGGFITYKVTDFHGLTLNENFTYSKALGLNATAQSSSGGTANDAFDLRKSYGVQAFNQKFIFNTFAVYQVPFYKNQQGLLGRIAGGWTIAPIFTAGSGLPIGCTTNSSSQSFGSADASGFSDNEQCVFTVQPTGAHRANRNVAGGIDPNNANIKVGTSTAGTGAAAVNLFANPTAVWDTVRAPILGIDEHDGGDGPIYGLPYFNLDTSITKRVRITERFSLELSGVVINVLNHLDFNNPGLSLATPQSFGVITSQGSSPRQIQMGARANF